MAEFFPGQRVACVRGNWEMLAYRLRLVVPIEGQEYVVRAVSPSDTGPSLRLHWLVNQVSNGGEPWFCAVGQDGFANFLPLVDDIAEISAEKKRSRPKVKELEPT